MKNTQVWYGKGIDGMIYVRSFIVMKAGKIIADYSDSTSRETKDSILIDFTIDDGDYWCYREWFATEMDDEMDDAGNCTDPGEFHRACERFSFSIQEGKFFPGTLKCADEDEFFSCNRKKARFIKNKFLLYIQMAIEAGGKNLLQSSFAQIKYLPTDNVYQRQLQHQMCQRGDVVIE